MGFLPWEIQVACPRKSQLRQSHTTQPTVHAGCFSVSIIHWTLTWTTGSLTCAQMNECDCTQGCMDTIRQSALKVDSARKIPCCIRDLNLRQQHASPMLYQLRYSPPPPSPLLLKVVFTLCCNRKGIHRVILPSVWSTGIKEIHAVALFLYKSNAVRCIVYCLR